MLILYKKTREVFMQKFSNRTPKDGNFYIPALNIEVLKEKVSLLLMFLLKQ